MDHTEQTDLYKVLRSQIEHLDNTISQRVVWLTLSQSFFVSGLAVLITGNPNDPQLIRLQLALLTLFPIVSIIMVLLSFFDIVSGLVYIKKLAELHQKVKREENFELRYPPLTGFNMLSQVKNFSPLAVPIIFIAFWVFFLIYK
jgi:hypothetical protein